MGFLPDRMTVAQARQAGAIPEVVELDEGMFMTGLQMFSDLGFVPNIFGALAESPTVLRAWLGLKPVANPGRVPVLLLSRKGLDAAHRLLQNGICCGEPR